MNRYKVRYYFYYKQCFCHCEKYEFLLLSNKCKTYPKIDPTILVYSHNISRTESNVTFLINISNELLFGTFFVIYICLKEMQSTKTKKKNNIYLSLFSKVSFAVFILVDNSKPEIVLDLHGRLDELIQQFHLLRLVCKRRKGQFFHHVMAHLNLKEKRPKYQIMPKFTKKFKM